MLINTDIITYENIRAYFDHSYQKRWRCLWGSSERNETILMNDRHQLNMIASLPADPTGLSFHDLSLELYTHWSFYLNIIAYHRGCVVPSKGCKLKFALSFLFWHDDFYLIWRFYLVFNIKAFIVFLLWSLYCENK